jgi:tRNA (guanine-N7-)-methyltransferase
VSRTRQLPLTELSPYLLSAPQAGHELDWKDIFGNDHPTEIEVGFGKGLFLLESSITRKETNFLGIEISRKYQLFTAARIAKRTLTNVRLAKADARSFLSQHVRAGSVAAIHAYFPDPWWKKRHLKRRLFTHDFVRQCERVLCPGSSLNLATDVQEYFDVICKLIQSCTRLSPTTAAPGSPSDNGGRTNFEQKFRLQNRPIRASTFCKS